MSIDTGDVKWRDSGHDMEFFQNCCQELINHNIKTVLDIACGRTGMFVQLCNQMGMNAWGIDPIVDINIDKLIPGTFESVVQNQHLLENFKFDCVTVHNTLHGKYHNANTVKQLFEFFRNHTKFIVISIPPFQQLGIDDLTTSFDKLYDFDGSHGGKSCYHKLFKVN
jgi:ubiquinone/menaquinone biosynthesis C-methylase UbiE